MIQNKPSSNQIIWLMTHKDTYEEYIDKIEKELFYESNFIEFEKKLKRYSGQDKENMEYALALHYSFCSGKGMENFIRQYRLYLIKNPSEYYNSYFCKYFMGIYELNMDLTEVNKRKVFDKTTGEILNMVINATRIPITCLSLGLKLSDEERIAFEDYILLYSKLFMIPSNGSFGYFDKYPIKETKTIRDRQLKLIETMMNQSRDLGIKINFFLREGIDPNGKGGGFVKGTDNHDDILILYDTGAVLADDESFYMCLYNLYHEFGHADYYYRMENLDSEIQKRIIIEQQVRRRNPFFYKFHHDNFISEQLADQYAIEQLAKGYGKEEMVAKICRERQSKLMTVQKEDNNFLELLYAEYVKITGEPIDLSMVPIKV